jgi:hypothetical protein
MTVIPKIVFIAECWTCQHVERFDSLNERDDWASDHCNKSMKHDVECYRQVWQ